MEEFDDDDIEWDDESDDEAGAEDEERDDDVAEDVRAPPAKKNIAGRTESKKSFSREKKLSRAYLHTEQEGQQPAKERLPGISARRIITLSVAGRRKSSSCCRKRAELGVLALDEKLSGLSSKNGFVPSFVKSAMPASK